MIHKNGAKPYVDSTVSCKVLEMEAVKYMFTYKISKFTTCVNQAFYNYISTDGVPNPPHTVIRVVPWVAFGFILFCCILGIVLAVVCIVMMLVLWNRR